MSPTMSSNGTHKDTEAGLPYDSPSTTPHAHKPAPVFHARTELTAFIGEFIGTFMFLALAFCGTQIALNGMSLQSLSADDEPSRPDVNKLLYIAFAFGVSLAINVAIFADVSGAKFNPAVSWLSPYLFSIFQECLEGSVLHKNRFIPAILCNTSLQ
jgi:aquaporin related protein